MKVIFINKKFVWLSIFIVIFSLLLIFIISNKNISSAIELSKNSIISPDFQDKINNLTSGSEKIAFLTFDDGPNVSITPKVLDILKETDVKASFFVIGKNVDLYPDIVKRAHNEGHFIANHG